MSEYLEAERGAYGAVVIFVRSLAQLQFYARILAAPPLYKPINALTIVLRVAMNKLFLKYIDTAVLFEIVKFKLV